VFHGLVHEQDGTHVSFICKLGDELEFLLNFDPHSKDSRTTTSEAIFLSLQETLWLKTISIIHEIQSKCDRSINCYCRTTESKERLFVATELVELYISDQMEAGEYITTASCNIQLM